MNRKVLLIGTLLVGALLFLIVTFYFQSPPESSSISSDEAPQDTAGGTDIDGSDEPGQPGDVTTDNGENPIMDRWGVPAEDIVRLSPDELARIRSESGSAAAQTNAGSAQSDRGAASPEASLRNALNAGGQSANSPGPDESDVGFLGEPPEAYEWGSTGSAPEAFGLGQPPTPPPESDAGDFGPGDLEDDPDSPPPEG